jgi:hypothetical protein
MVLRDLEEKLIDCLGWRWHGGVGVGVGVGSSVDVSRQSHPLVSELSCVRMFSFFLLCMCMFDITVCEMVVACGRWVEGEPAGVLLAPK